MPVSPLSPPPPLSPQDALFATATVREALAFSARLRLPASTTAAQRNKIVDDMITKLMLEKCQHTMVGNVIIRGVSGGEKKRTAIGIELIADPSILFLDEPTSGLDSYAAHVVVTILKELTRAGKTIISTIHQPSSEVFDIFDDVLLMADGAIVYHDSVKAMCPYFQDMGHVCPEHYNPADFIMFIMQTQGTEGAQRMIEGWQAHSANGIHQGDHGGTVAIADGEKAKDKRGSLTAPGNKGGPRPGCCTQMAWLGARELRNVIRDKGALIANTGGTLFLFIIISCVFFAGAKYSTISTKQSERTDYSKMSEEKELESKLGLKVANHFGALVQISIGAMFGLSQVRNVRLGAHEYNDKVLLYYDRSKEASCRWSSAGENIAHVGVQLQGPDRPRESAK